MKSMSFPVHGWSLKVRIATNKFKLLIESEDLVYPLHITHL